MSERAPEHGRATALQLAAEEAQPHWLAGEPMDPEVAQAEPFPALPGFPFLHREAGAIISGPTGGGRSSLVQACAYDAARAGLRVAYLGSEVSYPEFVARAEALREVRGDVLTADLREALSNRVRYLSLTVTMAAAWRKAGVWAEDAAERYDVLIIDPLSAVAAALDLNFDQSNAEYVQFYEALVRPLTSAGLAVVALDNIGHGEEAKSREKGVSAKGDLADLRFSSRRRTDPASLILTCRKVRSIRSPFRYGDAWAFDRDTQTVEPFSDAHDDGKRWRPTGLMQKVSLAVEAEPGIGKRQLREAIGSKAKHVDDAIEALVDEGYVEARQSGQKTEHYPMRPYREALDAEALSLGGSGPNFYEQERAFDEI